MALTTDLRRISRSMHSTTPRPTAIAAAVLRSKIA